MGPADCQSAVRSITIALSTSGPDGSVLVGELGRVCCRAWGLDVSGLGHLGRVKEEIDIMPGSAHLEWRSFWAGFQRA